MEKYINWKTIKLPYFITCTTEHFLKKKHFYLLFSWIKWDLTKYIILLSHNLLIYILSILLIVTVRNNPYFVHSIIINNLWFIVTFYFLIISTNNNVVNIFVDKSLYKCLVISIQLHSWKRSFWAKRYRSVSRFNRKELFKV